MIKTCMWCSKEMYSDSCANGICNDCHKEKEAEPTDIRGRIYFDNPVIVKGRDENGSYIELTGISGESLTELYHNCPAMRKAFADIIDDEVQNQIGVLEEQRMESRMERYRYE